MEQLEQEARADGKTLLILDTVAERAADRLYEPPRVDAPRHGARLRARPRRQLLRRHLLLQAPVTQRRYGDVSTMTRLLVLALVVLAAATAASTASAHGDASCTGAQLTGTFNAVRGSAGAGNITYKLVLKNASTHMCTLTGLPQGACSGRRGRRCRLTSGRRLPGC